MAKITAVADVVDVLLVEPDVHGDERGRFLETYRRSWFPQGREMVQANRSDKQTGALVGMHYHLHQADYWYVTSGRVRVVLHDLRIGAPTAGNTVAFDIGSRNEVGVYIPPGVGHGFAVLDDCTLTYLVDAYYNPADELGVRWDDPAITADWGVFDPVVSPRDQQNPGIEAIESHLRPRFGLRT